MGKGPAHPRPWGDSQPRTRSGEARRGHLKFRGFFLPCPAFLVTTNKEREKWEPRGERGEGERAAGGGGGKEQQQQHLPRDGGASPGRIRPHKMGAVCKQPPAWAPRAGGGRGRAAAAAARAPALLPPGARSRPDFPGGGGEAEGEGKAAAARSGCFFFSSGPLLRPSSAPAGPGHGRGPQPGRAGGRAGAEGEAAPPAPHKQAPPSAARTRTPAATPERLFQAGERAPAAPRAAAAR